MKFTKVFSLIFLFLLFGVSANAQNVWTGTYKFDESGGKTAGGSVIFIEHTLDITEKNGKLDAHFFSNGFQTSRDIYADGKIDGDKLLLYYRDEGEENFTSDYEKGELLLTLERKVVDGKTKILTYWAAFGPAIEKNEKSGKVYFEKTKENSKTKSAADIKWKRIETENKEFSILMPENFTFFFDKEGFSLTKEFPSMKNIYFRNMRLMKGYKDGVIGWFESYDVENGKEDFSYFLNSQASDNGKTTDYKIGKSALRQVISETDNSYSVINYFYSDKRVYQIGFSARDKNNKTLAAFLTGIEFQGKYLFLNDKIKTIEAKETAVLENLTTTPLEITYLENDPKKTLETQNPDKTTENDSDEKKLFLISKPRPRYTEKARRQNQQGTVRLRVTFGDDGQIQKIDVLKGLENGLTESGIIATRRINFLPPEKKGEPVTVVKLIDFNFSIY